jgi:hypothetical protein
MNHYTRFGSCRCENRKEANEFGDMKCFARRVAILAVLHVLVRPLDIFCPEPERLPLTREYNEAADVVVGGLDTCVLRKLQALTASFSGP